MLAAPAPARSHARTHLPLLTISHAPLGGAQLRYPANRHSPVGRSHINRPILRTLPPLILALAILALADGVVAGHTARHRITRVRFLTSGALSRMVRSSLGRPEGCVELRGTFAIPVPPDGADAPSRSLEHRGRRCT